MLTQVSRTPANPAYTATELAFQLKDSGAKALVTQASCLKLAIEATEIANIPKTRILLIGEEKSNQVQHFVDFIALAKNKPALDRASSSHTDLAYIVYSSVTTGYVLELVSLCGLLACVMDDIIPLVVFLMLFDCEIDVMLIWNTCQMLMHSLNHDKQMLSVLCVYLREIFYFPHDRENVSRANYWIRLPKGVLLTHRNVVANTLMIENVGLGKLSWNGGPNGNPDVVSAVLPFYHIYGENPDPSLLIPVLFWKG